MTGRERIIEPPGCCLDAAAYLLGALEPAEAHAFVRHLEQGGACRDEMAALAPVIGDLAAAAPPRRVPLQRLPPGTVLPVPVHRRGELSSRQPARFTER